MADNSYGIEIKIASKNGWHTPQEARNYYGRYDRMGITWHWWGDGSGASNHDNIVNYMNNQAALGNKSVNYVLSDNKITLCVNPDNVAWASNSGNPTTVSVELQPTLGAEGYKKAGWLLDQLEQRYGRSLASFKHSYWTQTACPGSIDIGRIRAEADKWKRGEYEPKPAPAPAPAPAPVPTPKPPATVKLEIKDVPNKKVKLIRDASLWNLQFAKYPDAQSVKTIPSGTEFEVSAVVTHPLGSKYYISEYSYAKGIPNGINVKDTDHPDPETLNAPVSVPPVVIPVPIPPKNEEPTPEVPVPPVENPDAGVPDTNAILAFLQMLAKLITDFVAKFKK
ncbi:N-acetylmuramoyl-L-alanine amidase [Candidatus Saccharibacteria bacterium]|nr:N-acetylmuramoyl-L-alanine amidase [Candidatus Saccharibacteria bacterium]